MSSGGEQPYNVKKMHDGPGAESSATIGNKLVEIQEQIDSMNETSSRGNRGRSSSFNRQIPAPVKLGASQSHSIS